MLKDCMYFVTNSAYIINKYQCKHKNLGIRSFTRWVYKVIHIYVRG